MATQTVQQILDDVRGMLADTQVAGGEYFPNSILLGTGANGGGSLFGEPYRTMFGKLVGASQRVQPNVHVVLPANTSVLIPSTYQINDFSEPEMIEERPALNSIAIASTDTGTPITVTTTGPHGLSTGVEGAVSGVSGSPAPWGNWFITVTSPTQFTLNGSASDGVAGTGGFFYPSSNAPFTEVFRSDLVVSLDGSPASQLSNYVWSNGRLQFRGSTQDVELRITYYASGTAPTNPNYVIWIDNCRDFLATATAANAARSRGWMQQYETLRNRAYGDPTHPEEDSLIDLFYRAQVLASQAGPSRRQRPFRDRRYRFGSYLLG